MRNFFLCLILWFAVPAWANSLEETMCSRAPDSVAELASSQKLCHSFVMALQKVPGAMTAEVLALLTPENLAVMGTLTSVWIGSQGIPAVGQAVDAALLTLGVILLASQAAELSKALWEYARRSVGAQTQNDLEAAADHLAHAISVAGVNVVALVLTKKVAGRVKRSPPANHPPRLATSSGTPPVGTPGRGALPSAVQMAAEGSGGARSLPSTSAKRSVSTRYLLTQVDAWRKPKLAADGRILPYKNTRNPPAPIVNLGRNRAGKTLANGRDTVRFDENGFAEFDVRFEMILDESHIGSGRADIHSRAANQRLHEAISADPKLGRELGLSLEEIALLPRSTGPPNGYVWHHHQDVGRMQLITKGAHELARPHTGGMAIWGGGY